MNRREFLAGGAGLSGLTIAGALLPLELAAAPRSREIVLVHGAQHGAWCWYKLLPRLVAAGHRVTAVDLPGHGRNHLPRAEQSRAAYVDSILSALAECAEPALLVGHDLAGMAISLAAEARPERVAELVYLAAFLPRSGDSVLSLLQRDRESLVPKRSVVSKDRSSILLRDDALHEVLYADCGEEDVALARLSLVAEPTQPYGAPVSLSAERFGTVAKSYIECTADRAVGPALQRAMAAAGSCRRIVSLPSGHAPFFSMPERLTAALLEIAA